MEVFFLFLVALLAELTIYYSTTSRSILSQTWAPQSRSGRFFVTLDSLLIWFCQVLAQRREKITSEQVPSL